MLWDPLWSILYIGVWGPLYVCERPAYMPCGMDNLTNFLAFCLIVSCYLLGVWHT